MATIVDPFKQDKVIQAQSLRDLATSLKQAGQVQAQADIGAAQIELQGARLTKQESKDNQDQVNALKRIEAQGAQQRLTQAADFKLKSDAKSKQRAADTATFNQLTGKQVTAKDISTPTGFDKVESDGKTSKSKLGVVETTDDKEKIILQQGDQASLEDQRATLESQLQVALASPNEKAGRKAALFIDNKLTLVKNKIKIIQSDRQFKARRSKLSEDLGVPEAAITPGNLTKFETELVDKLNKGPEIPGSQDVTLQFLAKFPQWQQAFTTMREQGVTEIDLNAPEVQDFLIRNKRMFNTFAEHFIKKSDEQINPILSKEATLYRSERDKFLKTLGALSELRGYIALVKAGDGYIWDSDIEASEDLKKLIGRTKGLTIRTHYDEGDLAELDKALVQMRVESINPLLRSLENVVDNSPVQVQGLFFSEVGERLKETGIQSDTLDRIEKRLAESQK